MYRMSNQAQEDLIQKTIDAKHDPGYVSTYGKSTDPQYARDEQKL